MLLASPAFAVGLTGTTGKECVMNTEVTMVMKGEAGIAVLRGAARTFAMLTIKSRLDGTKMWNAPWSGHDYRTWMKGIERERLSYRDLLRSTGLDIPEVPQMEWRMVEVPKAGLTVWVGSGKFYPSYNGPHVTLASQAWADAFLAPLLAKEVA